MTDVADVAVRPASVDDRPTVERLWLMFRHDISEFRGLLPAPDGSFTNERLHSAFTDADWAPYLLTSGESPAGFVFVRGVSAATRVMNSFFVVRGARGSGIGRRAVERVVALHPGPWEVPFQDDNVPAARFWRRVIAGIAGDAWSEEPRPVPGRPDLPPDVWASFRVPPEPR